MRKIRALTYIGVVACGVILQTVSAWSDVTSGSTDPSVSGPQINTLPPMFDAAVATNMGSMMLNCFNVGAAINTIKNAFDGGGGSGTADDALNAVSGLSTSLGGKVPLVMGGGCGSTQMPDGLADFKCPSSPAAIDELVKKNQLSVQRVLGAIDCKKNKFEAIQTQISCLNNQSQLLQAQVGTLQKAFQDNIQRMQTDTASIKSMETDRNTQLADVTAKLGGDKNNGSPGLLALKNAVQGAVNAEMPQQILAMKENFKKIDLQRVAMDEATQSRTMQLTTNCFNTNSAGGYRCAPNGPPVSIREYALCRYEQAQNLGTGGVIERNSVVTNQAAAGRASLDALLSSIMTDSAKIARPSADAQAATDAAINSTVTIVTPDDIENQYGSQLAAYNGKGINIHDFVMAQMKSCFAKANQVITREKAMKSSGLGAQNEAFNRDLRATQDAVGSFVNKYSQMYTDAMAALTGQHLPLNTSACTGGSPAVQQSCLDDLKNNMTGLLMGNTPNSTMNIQIKGTNVATYIPVSCQGLAGCVTALQNTSSNLQKEVTRLDQFKKDYILKANQNVENFTKQMATTLSPQSAMLQQKLQQLDQALAGLGVSPMRVKGVKGESLDKDADGLPVAPKNVMGLIGSQMNPPMPDFHGEELERGMSEMGHARQELDGKRSEVSGAIAAVAAHGDSCKGESKGKATDGLAGKLADFGECVQYQDYCTKVLATTEKDKLAELSASISNLDLSADELQGVDPSVLETGVAACRARASASNGKSLACDRNKPMTQEAYKAQNDGKADGFSQYQMQAQQTYEACKNKAQSGEDVYAGSRAPGRCPDSRALSKEVKKYENATGQKADDGGDGKASAGAGK